MSICAKCGGVVSPKELYAAWQQLIFVATKTNSISTACGNTWMYNWYDFKRVALEGGWDYGDGIKLDGNGIKIIKKGVSTNENK